MEIIRSISTDSIHQEIPGLSGTAMGDGLLTGVNMLESTDSGSTSQREKTIVLVTDGDANLGIHPEIAARYAHTKNIRIYTIGIGSSGETYISVPSLS